MSARMLQQPRAWLRLLTLGRAKPRLVELRRFVSPRGWVVMIGEPGGTTWDEISWFEAVAFTYEPVVEQAEAVS